MKLIDFDSELWETFRGAYGTVKEEIKTLMEEKEGIPPQQKLCQLELDEENDYQIAFENLFESLWHQMSFYKATYLALPYLVKLLEQKENENDVRWQYLILSRVGFCLATDVSSENQDDKKHLENEIMESYLSSIAILKEKAERFLFLHIEELRQLDRSELSQFYTSILAILGDREAAFVLINSAWDTCYLLCDACEYYNEDLTLSSREDLKKIIPAESVIGKWDEKSYKNTYLWFSNILYLLGDKEAVEKLSYYYGTYTCPECGKKGIVMELIKNYLCE